MKLIKSVLLIVFSLFIQQTWACSCGAPPSIGESLKSYDAVFTGTVLKIEDDLIPSDDDPSLSYASSQTVTIKLETVYKTAAGTKTIEKIVKIKTAISGAACGYYFQKGKKYIVYAYTNKQDGQLWTNLCTRTKRYDKAEAKALKRLSKK